ncbi:MAG: polysaccharide pyruvyl transferase CsaB [Thermostichales cyanobacterium BF4_bins_65]
MRALICGYYGYGNGGDEALLQALLQFLPPTWQPLVISGNPQATQTLHGIPAVGRGRVGGVLWRERGVFVFGGGSLIQDSTSWRSPLFYLGLMGLAQQRGWQTLAWAQGLGPLRRRWIAELTRRCLQGCQAISVRDQESSRLLKNWGIPHHLAPDPVWALEPGPVPPISAAPAIAVILRPHPHLSRRRLERLTQALEILQQQTASHLLLLPMQWPQDLPLAQYLHQQLPASHLIQLRDPRLIAGTLAQVHLTISMRYHGLVMAARGGSRCFGLSYDPKVRLLLDSLDLPGWNLEDLPEDPQAMAQSWLESFQGSPLPAVVRQQWQQQAETHRQILEQIG